MQVLAIDVSPMVAFMLLRASLGWNMEFCKWNFSCIHPAMPLSDLR